MKNETSAAGRIRAYQDHIVITRDLPKGGGSTSTVFLAPGLAVHVDIEAADNGETGRIELHNDDRGWWCRIDGRLQITAYESTCDRVVIDYAPPCAGSCEVKVGEAFKPLPLGQLAQLAEDSAASVRVLLDQ